MLAELLDTIYPEHLYCISCGNLIDQTRTYHLCDHCMTHINWNLDPIANKDGLKIIKCVDYGIYSRSMIFALKYDDHRYIARTIANIMYDRIKEAGLIDYLNDSLLVPVPLHRTKLKTRGFNQSELIAQDLAQMSEVARVADVLIRVKETRPMRGLGPYERRSNIAGAIELEEGSESDIRDKKIVLIDDFYTTGSTAKECSNVLNKARPKDILFISFAAR